MRWCYIGMGCLYVRLLGGLVFGMGCLYVRLLGGLVFGMGCLYMRLLGALVLHRDGMPICEATRWAGVTLGWDAYI